jgi:ATP-dependent Lon protease
MRKTKTKAEERLLEQAAGWQEMPLLPLRDVVVFPGMIVPLFIGRARSVTALDYAMEADKHVLLATQRKADCNDPGYKDLYKIGTLTSVLQILKLPDGSVKVLIEGLARHRLQEVFDTENGLVAVAEEVMETTPEGKENEALIRHLSSQFENYVRLNRKIPQETLASIMNISDLGRLADNIAIHASLKVSDKQKILASLDVRKRALNLGRILTSEIEILELEQKIRGEVRRQMEKSQKEYYLNEQIKAIQKELGRDGENPEEIAELISKVRKSRMTDEARGKAEQEIQRLKTMPMMSPEAAVVRNYLDWLLALPWQKRTKDRLDIDLAEKILNEDHYGLKKPKERILEFLAVRQLVKESKGPILCFAGPPGVGKTSLARSIARALNRKFIRISLGGVRDEAEIRGHRRTYIGALPGRILQNIRKVGSRNPVFLLDEVDKLSVDFRGDPASALLEVLDPEQNHTFVDHFLEVEFDLSEVMFIATANVLDPVAPALKDRMETIQVPSYTELEKFHIAKDFLMPKQVKRHGLKKSNAQLTNDAILELIRSYTREAGVRNLERELGSVYRKLARSVATGRQKGRRKVTPKVIHELLGVPRFRRPEYETSGGVGVSTGLAWTETGGEVLRTEATLMEGKGELLLTGQLGDVMQESGRAALSFARSRTRALHLERDFHKRYDIHVHIPEGAIPKDGPSAGITIATAIISSLTGQPVQPELAMTGEITLRGQVLPVGGIKEKLLAAHRSKIKHVIMPRENEKDLEEFAPEVLQELDIILVDNMDQVLEAAMLQS